MKTLCEILLGGVHVLKQWSSFDGQRQNYHYNDHILLAPRSS